MTADISLTFTPARLQAFFFLKHCVFRAQGAVMSAVQIIPAHRHDIAAVVDFVMRARAQTFPQLASADLPPDLQHFTRVYGEEGDGRFLIARREGEIVAAVGYRPYDHRFAQLDYAGSRAVEVVRLFVLPDYRRSGLATTICDALKRCAQEQGVDVLYLHTHPFLPGAIDFWQRQGFGVTDVEDDPVWQTIHMECRLQSCVTT
jgi:GNAT superfamily N-acetyltransferase